MDKKEDILKIFPYSIKAIFQKIMIDYEKLQEIRLRVNGPLIIIYDNQEFFLSIHGLTIHSSQAYQTTIEEVREVVEYISNYSLYAYEDEIRQGFITIKGGHRVGIAGKAILENERIKNIKYISFINIRLSHQVKGCSLKVLPYIYDQKRAYHTLIISPPRSGKTTLLRDIIYQLSNGIDGLEGLNIGVVDERSEIAACYLGVPQNDLGMRTDVLDCCPKASGMMMMIRSMSPDVIAIDEIGSREDVKAMEYVMNCGCQIIATVHGNSIEDLKNKPVLRRLVEEKIFERYIVLNSQQKIGNIEAIFNEHGSNLLDN